LSSSSTEVRLSTPTSKVSTNVKSAGTVAGSFCSRPPCRRLAEHRSSLGSAARASGWRSGAAPLMEVGARVTPCWGEVGGGQRAPGWVGGRRTRGRHGRHRTRLARRRARDVVHLPGAGLPASRCHAGRRGARFSAAARQPRENDRQPKDHSDKKEHGPALSHRSLLPAPPPRSISHRRGPADKDVSLSAAAGAGRCGGAEILMTMFRSEAPEPYRYTIA
jgi:hypothetical protein